MQSAGRLFNRAPRPGTPGGGSNGNLISDSTRRMILTAIFIVAVLAIIYLTCCVLDPLVVVREPRVYSGALRTVCLRGGRFCCRAGHRWRDLRGELELRPAQAADCGPQWARR